MKKFQIITTKNNSSKQLKKWLKQKKVKYEEWKIQDENVKKFLLHCDQFTNKYCDVEDCKIDLPAIHLVETDEYFYADTIDFDGFYKLNKLLEID
jgi:hypothetical protein